MVSVIHLTFTKAVKLLLKAFINISIMQNSANEPRQIKGWRSWKL